MEKSNKLTRPSPTKHITLSTKRLPKYSTMHNYLNEPNGSNNQNRSERYASQSYQSSHRVKLNSSCTRLKPKTNSEVTTPQSERHEYSSNPKQHKTRCSVLHSTSIAHYSYIALLLLSCSIISVVYGNDSSERSSINSVPTPIPEDSFIEQPTNASVVKGHVAVMRCKASQPVNHCRWYYLEMNANFYEDGSKPKLVKEFKPTNDIDCSIRFTKVRKVQEGQWLCQARRYMSTAFYNTRPAFLEVITESDEKEYEDRNVRQEDSDETLPIAPDPSQARPRPSPVVPTILPRPVSNRGTAPPPVRPAEIHPTEAGRPLGPQYPRRDHFLPRPRDPTAPTAIPAIGPPLSREQIPPRTLHRGGSPDSHPSHGRLPVVPHSHNDFNGASPRGGSRTPTDNQRGVFAYSPDDHIQNTRTGLSATLPCQVNTPVTSCSWIMPNNALFVWNDADSSVGRSLSINTPIVPNGLEEPKEYEFVGDRKKGNCSLTVHRVRHHDEGNWRCVVSIPGSTPSSIHPAFASSAPSSDRDIQGPLLHLHLLDFHHNLQGIPEPSMISGTNITLIILFLVGLILFVVGTIVIYCCYKRVWSKPDVTANKNLQQPQAVRSTESEYTQQWFQGRNLKIVDPNYTDDFKLRNVNGNDYNIRKVDAVNLKNGSHVQYSDIDHYNQYMKMAHGGGSVRSSASSNTTLSTMAPDPHGRDRSISFGTPSISPINMSGRISHQSHMMNPNGSIMTHHSPPPGDGENVSFYEIHRQLQRPVSLYSTSHVYEEIQEKIPPYSPVYPPPPLHHVVNSQGMVIPAQGLPVGALASTPVYTNVIEDHDGYLIPSKSAKIVNTPTGDVDPTQYLAMTGDVLPGPHTKFLNEAPYQPQNVHINNMNNLSYHQPPTKNIQLHQNEAELHMKAKEAQQRRFSNESQLSIEQNNTPEKLNKKSSKVSSSSSKEDRNKQNPNLNSTTPVKQVNSKTQPTTPNSRRQRMPLPSQPISLKTSNQPKFPLNQNHTSSKSNLATLSSQHSSSKSNLSPLSSIHQRTTSLPDTGNTNASNHAKSPSLVPTPENYDVPRSLGEVPRAVNGSEVSLDDIDGTIV